MSYLTDRGHCVSVAEDAIRDLEQLAKAWLREDEYACAPTSSGTPGVGSGTSNPTERVATGDGEGMVDTSRYRDRDRLGRFLLREAERLHDELANWQPRSPTGPCATQGCNGSATHGDRCFECWRWKRANPGFEPTQMVDRETGRSLVDDWNAQRHVSCQCSTSCCPAGECVDLVPPSKGRMSQRCYQRQSRLQRSA